MVNCAGNEKLQYVTFYNSGEPNEDKDKTFCTVQRYIVDTKKEGQHFHSIIPAMQVKYVSPENIHYHKCSSKDMYSFIFQVF